jgi:hypothetical protein
MKKTILLLAISFAISHTFAQQWTNAQLESANTGAAEYKLTAAEKETILYLNLCRLYPSEFVTKVLATYTGIPGVIDQQFEKYKKSLSDKLSTLQPMPPLVMDELLYDDAKCYGNEIATNDRKPHQRVDCIKRDYAECLYWGKGEGKHIALQWLIDSGIENLGHRNICLAPAFIKIGVKVNPHPEYGHCAVAEFSR